MKLKIVGKNLNGTIEFEQEILLPYDLYFEFFINKRYIYTQLQSINEEIVDNLTKNLKKRGINFEIKENYIIFRKKNKECFVFFKKKTNKSLMDNNVYEKKLFNFILKQFS
jgi:hypothetical protein